MERKLTFLFLSVFLIFDKSCIHITGFGDYDSDSPHHRARRNVFSIADVPQPSVEYPLVLFSDSDYDGSSVNQFYSCVKEGEYHVWGRTDIDQQRDFVYKSLILMPNRTLTFKAGFSSGNEFFASIHNVTNISDIHLWMFDNQDVGGSSGVWYTQWEHWVMEFAVKLEPCPSCTPTNCTPECYFGTCGIDGKCQCASGHSGTQCEIRPNTTEYPSMQYPLVLFPNKYFKGTPKPVAPDTYEVFAQNRQKTLDYSYQSMRILHRRKVTFQRVDHNVEYEIPIGSDIEDIPSFMTMNDEVGDALWISYSPAIVLDFAVKVEDIPACSNCSSIGGSCFKGYCECLPGYSGADCDIRSR